MKQNKSKKILLALLAVTLIALAVIFFLNRGQARWTLIEEQAKRADSSKESNFLLSTLFLNDIYLNYDKLDCEGDPALSPSYLIKPASLSLIKGHLRKNKYQALISEDETMFGAWGIGRLMKKQKPDSLAITVKSSAKVRLKVYEVYVNRSPLKKFKENDLERLQKKYAKFSFMADIPGNGQDHAIRVPLLNYSVKSARNIKGLVFLVQALSQDKMEVAISDIRLEHQKHTILSSYPSVRYLKQSKRWLKSLFLPGNSRISYTIHAERDFVFDGELGHLPGKSQRYRILVNGVPLVDELVTETTPFSHIVSPIGGKAVVEISVGGDPDSLGVLGNLTFSIREEAPSNVICYLVDALRHDFGGVVEDVFGNYFSSGAVFSHAYSNSTWTGDSLPTLFSGKYRLSLVDETMTHPNLLDSDHLLGEYLKSKGYTTAAFIANSFLIKANCSQGFDSIFLNWGDKRKVPVYPDTEEYTAVKYGSMKDDIESFIRRNNHKKLFIFIHTLEPHDPLELPRELRHYSRDLAPDLLNSVYGPLKDKLTQPTEEQVSALKALYKDEVLQADRFFNSIIRFLEDHNVINRSSLLILTADHGERFFEHGQWEHGRPDIYNEVIRIPMMIRGRGFQPGIYDDNVQIVDIYPTIMEWLGDQKIKDMPGESLVASVQGRIPDFSSRLIYVDGAHPLNLFGGIMGNLKVIFTDGIPQVFDLDKDPGERENLAGLKIYSSLIEKVLSFRQSIQSRSGRKPVIVSDEEAERLRTLGYIR